jgi:hypothetical protein
VRRLCAAGAAVAAASGVLAVAIASVRVDIFRYVSEAGVEGAPHASLYRAGIWLVAAAFALLVAPAWATARLASAAFALAAPATVVSGAVACSPGCPLPPFDRPTGADLLHAGASIAALLLCGWVMLVYALRPVDSPLRRAGRAGVALAGPLLGLAAFGLVFVGQGTFTGSVERAALLATSVWLIATAALHVRDRG